MRRFRAAFGSALFLLVAPGVVAGLVPWLLTDWQYAAYQRAVPAWWPRLRPWAPKPRRR